MRAPYRGEESEGVQIRIICWEWSHAEPGRANRASDARKTARGLLDVKRRRSRRTSGAEAARPRPAEGDRQRQQQLTVAARSAAQGKTR